MNHLLLNKKVAHPQRAVPLPNLLQNPAVLVVLLQAVLLVRNNLAIVNLKNLPQVPQVSLHLKVLVVLPHQALPALQAVLAKAHLAVPLLVVAPLRVLVLQVLQAEAQLQQAVGIMAIIIKESIGTIMGPH